MNGLKNPLASTTIWGGIAAMIVGLLNLLGYALSPADVGDIAQLLTGLAANVAGIVAIYGRIKAKDQIDIGLR